MSGYDFKFFDKVYKTYTLRYAEMHFTVPQPNQQSQELDAGSIADLLKKQFDYNFYHHSVLQNGDDPVDRAKVLINEKKKWTEQLYMLRPVGKNQMTVELRQLKKIRKGSAGMMRLKTRLFLDHIKDDPLPGLIGSRNWLFSGSTAVTLNKDDSANHVITCGGRNLSSLCNLEISEDGVVKNRWDLTLKNDEPILQICANSDADPVISTRQQHFINIYKLKDNSFKRLLIKKLPKDSYFTSISLMDNNMALSKNSGSVAVFDIERNKLRFSFPGCKRIKASCDLDHSRHNLHWRKDGLWVLNGKMMYNIDGKDIVNTWDFKKTLNTCEEATVMFDSVLNPHLTFVATTHSLLQVDLRNMKHVKTWTHLMGQVPEFGKALKLVDEEELLLLHSSAADDGVAIINGKASALLPPHLMPSVTDTFREAKIRLHCLDPDVEDRPHFSIIGCCYLPVKEGFVHEVIQNAGGDIFIRKIQKNVDFDHKHDLQTDESIWDSWDDYGTRCTSLPLVKEPRYSEVVDMGNAFNYLSQPQEDPYCWNYARANWTSKLQFRPDHLKLYKDYIARKILPVWGIHEDPSDEEVEEGEVSDEEVTSVAKVTDWLNRHSNN